jgi:hypothetical protein
VFAICVLAGGAGEIGHEFGFDSAEAFEVVGFGDDEPGEQPDDEADGCQQQSAAGVARGTEIEDGANPADDLAQWFDDARREQLRETLPTGRVVGSEDVAALAVDLMTNTAVTGSTFDIDGGQQLVEG